jgi:hypothetical protein
MVNHRVLCSLASAAFFVPLILLLDGTGVLRQMLIGGATTLFLIVLVVRHRVAVAPVIVAIVIATTGELILSVGWGLYTYKHALIPLYVPFGHGVFYVLATITAEQAAMQRNSSRIVRAVLFGGTLWAVVSLIALHDTWGAIWWMIAATLIGRSMHPLLLAVCCSETMLLEWLGTALGNWHWSAVVPHVGLHSANPPSGVGLLYVVLDFVTVLTIARFAQPKTVKSCTSFSVSEGRAEALRTANSEI